MRACQYRPSSALFLVAALRFGLNGLDGVLNFGDCLRSGRSVVDLAIGTAQAVSVRRQPLFQDNVAGLKLLKWTFVGNASMETTGENFCRREVALGDGDNHIYHFTDDIVRRAMPDA